MKNGKGDFLLLIVCAVPLLLVAVGVAWFGGLFVLIGISRMSEIRSATGTVAMEWLNSAFSVNWKQNPFPAGSILGIRGVRDSSDGYSYWFRVTFKPSLSPQIMDNIRSYISVDRVNPVALKTIEKPLSLGQPVGTPDFYRPQELGPSRIVIVVVRHNGSTTIIGESDTISFSQAKGVAYIHFLQL